MSIFNEASLARLELEKFKNISLDYYNNYVTNKNDLKVKIRFKGDAPAIAFFNRDVNITDWINYKEVNKLKDLFNCYMKDNFKK